MAADQARAAVNDLTLRQNDWTLGAYCASFCTFVAGHHGLEDQAVFPYLKGSDERLAPVIDRLEAEHHVVHDLLMRLDTRSRRRAPRAGRPLRSGRRARRAHRRVALAPVLRGARAAGAVGAVRLLPGPGLTLSCRPRGRG